jgi:hypothetical protein
MKRARRRQIGVLAVLIAIATAILVAAGGASAVTTVVAGNLVIKLDGSSDPKALPRNKMAPIGFHGSASLSTKDGSHIPAALSTQLLVDKHIKLDTTGLPTCTLDKLQATGPAAAMKACGDALIGQGTSTAQVQFPEQSSFEAKGPLLAFNGPSGGGGGAYGGNGYQEQLYYVYADVPVPTALIAVGKVSKATGRYGYKISISIPKIAGGAGSFKSAKFTINRKWTYKGQKHSFLNAECANGHFSAQVEVAFNDGTNLTGNVVQACKSTS